MSAPRRSRPVRWPSIAAAALVATACSRPSVGFVEIVPGDGARSPCVALWADDGKEPPTRTAPAPWTPERHNVVGVGLGAKREISIWAEGYAQDCTTPSAPAERSVTTSLVVGQVVQLTLEAAGRTDGGTADAGAGGGSGGGGGGSGGGAGSGGTGGGAPVDADGDGVTADRDCDDHDARRSPNRTEVCDNGLDDDCDSAQDCADPGCDAVACDDQLPCTPSSSCQQGSCRATVSCTAPTDGGCFEYCSSGLACIYRVRTGQTCTDGDPCSYGETCNAQGMCTPGTQCVDTNPCTLELCATDACMQTTTRFATCGDAGACNGQAQCLPGGFTRPVTNVDVDSPLVWRARDAGSGCGGSVTLNTDTAILTGSSSCVAGLRLDEGSAVQQDGGPALYVIATDGDLTIPQSLTINAVGSRPLVFVVRGRMTVAGRIDVAANGTSSGAGAPACLAGQGVAVPSRPASEVLGGGGGGGFGLAGGRGSWFNGAWTLAGQPEGGPELTPLRGGCPGGNSHRASSVARGGGGGGALQLSASGALIVEGTGKLSAGGGGGARAELDVSGGGGGGSGGALLLEGATITLRSGSVVTANGGGGGQGQNTSSGSAGSDATESTSAAAGGCNNVCGYCGGSGGARSSAASDAATTSGCSGSGGGGGGGGVGRIRFNAANCTVSGTVSPAPTSDTIACR